MCTMMRFGGVILGVVVGGTIGGFIGRAMGFYGPNQVAGYLMSILGGIVLLAIYRMVARKSV